MEDQHEGRRARIRFGPRPHQTIAHEHAEQILTSFAAQQPSTFGRYLMRVIVAELPQRKTPSNGQAS